MTKDVQHICCNLRSCYACEEHIFLKYHLLGKEETEEEGQAHSEEDTQNQYHLLSNAEINKTNMYYFTGSAGDKDYEDPEVEGIEDVYHILEGPIPERGENYDNEPNIYEVPVITRN